MLECNTGLECEDCPGCETQLEDRVQDDLDELDAVMDEAGWS
jgi:hypothetical protein